MSKGLERPEIDVGNSAAMIYMAADAISTCHTPPFSSRFGREYPGFRGVFAFLAMPVLAAFLESEAILLWWKLWIAVVVVRRIGMFIRERRGDWEHSGYRGWPWLAMRIPFVRTETQARACEPFLFAAAAYFATPYDQGFAAFLAMGAGSLFIVNIFHAQIRYKERIAFRDAQFAMERHARLMNGEE
jgi:hypothetical protein